jgi:hypothetical protein
MQCQNNIRNLALGVLNYESQRGALPQSTDAPPSGANRSVDLRTGGTLLSWIVRILPHVEQQALYDQFDLSQRVSQLASTPEEAQPSLLLCPSDSAQGRVYTSIPFLAGARNFAKGNYAAYVSPEHGECMFLAKGALVETPQPLAHVVDGTSNTLLLAEVRTRDHPQDPRGAWSLAWIGSSMLAADMHGTTAITRICRQTNPPPYVPNPAFEEFAILPNAGIGPSIPPDSLNACPRPADARLEGMPCQARDDATAAPRSQHVGGVNGANLDGSVRWVSDDIEALVLGSLVGVNDGMLLPE